MKALSVLCLLLVAQELTWAQSDPSKTNPSANASDVAAEVKALRVSVTIAAMVLQRANPVLTAGMLLLGLGFLYFAGRLALIHSSQSAGRLLLVSVIYLPLVFVLQVLARG